MKELQKIKIRMESTNQYGDKFAIEQEVDEDYCDMGEMEIYHNAYLNFLKAVGFCFNLNDEVVILSDDKHIEYNYEDGDCEDVLCDGDCENCEEDYDDEDDYEYRVRIDSFKDLIDELSYDQICALKNVIDEALE